MNDSTLPYVRMPAWVWIVAAFGVAWNIFGLVQLADFFTQTRESLMIKGMSAEAASLYYALPLWMKLAFATGSIGGLAGSVLLALRRRAAVPVLGLSLAGYVALWMGDYGYGVFAVVAGQLVMLSLVVAIAVGLLGAALQVQRR